LTPYFLEVQERLSGALSEVPLMRSNPDWIREQLYRRYGFDIPAPPPGPHRLQCTAMLDAVSELRGALRALATILASIDKSDPAVAFFTLVNQILPEGYLTLSEKYEIIDLLDRSCDRAKIGFYYSQVLDRDPPIIIHNAEDLVNSLGQAASDPESLSPLVQAIDLIADDIADVRAAAECRKHAETVSARIDDSTPPGSASVSQIEQLHARHMARRKYAQTAGIDNAYIVLLLDPYHVNPDDQFLLSCCLYYEEQLIHKFSVERPLSLADVSTRAIGMINDALERAEGRRSAKFRPLVEFILPRDQINLPVESWYAESSYRSLATQFAVVVRDLQRQSDPILRLACRTKWGRVETLSTSDVMPISKWITCSDDPRGPGELYQCLLPDSMIIIGLTFPPEYSIHKFQMKELLDTGIPVAFWPHKCDHAAHAKGSRASEAYEEFKIKFTELCASRPIRDLPHIIYELRKVSFTDVESGVALLWDDPARIVKPSQYKLASPTRQDLPSE
jgi:vWA-MoxR associated protein C-terminal domain